MTISRIFKPKALPIEEIVDLLAALLREQSASDDEALAPEVPAAEKVQVSDLLSQQR